MDDKHMVCPFCGDDNWLARNEHGYQYCGNCDDSIHDNDLMEADLDLNINFALGLEPPYFTSKRDKEQSDKKHTERSQNKPDKEA